MSLLITTPGASNANSWASQEEYLAYALTKFPLVTWHLSATSDYIDQVLIAACRLLNVAPNWTGAVSSSTQALTWPRLGMLDRNGNSIDSTANPSDLKLAQCELAAQIGSGVDTTSDNDAVRAGVKSVKAGSVQVDFQAISDTMEAVDVAVRRDAAKFNYLKLPDAVRLLLVPSWYTESTVRPGPQIAVFGIGAGHRGRSRNNGWW